MATPIVCDTSSDVLLDLVVLQRLVGKTRDGRRRWRTLCSPVPANAGFAQLDVVREHRREHRLLQGVPAAWVVGSITLD
jgi:hypothetical protein